MMTKEDYMHLPKERLAEMLVERDKQSVQPCVQPYVNVPHVQIVDDDSCPFGGGKCFNKFKDCVGCPKTSTTFTTTSTNIAEKKDE